MVSHLIHTWNLNLAYARRLVADLAEEQMTVQPAPGMNHAAWVLGHLACSGDLFAPLIGSKPVCPPEWRPLFDWNSTPKAGSAQYPSKAELLAAIEAVHAGIAAALPVVPASRWTDPMPIDEIRGLGILAAARHMTTDDAHELGELGAVAVRALGLLVPANEQLDFLAARLAEIFVQRHRLPLLVSTVSVLTT